MRVSSITLAGIFALMFVFQGQIASAAPEQTENGQSTTPSATDLTGIGSNCILRCWKNWEEGTVQCAGLSLVQRLLCQLGVNTEFHGCLVKCHVEASGALS